MVLKVWVRALLGRGRLTPRPKLLTTRPVRVGLIRSVLVRYLSFATGLCPHMVEIRLASLPVKSYFSPIILC